MSQRLPNLGEGEEYDLHALATPLYNVGDKREAAMIAWRSECFEGAGIAMGDAMLLAMRRDVDREKTERMKAAGATDAQLLDILT